MDSVFLSGDIDFGVLLILFAVLGGVTGFVSGLLGVGGGVIVIPGLYFIFSYLGFEADSFMHMFIGTSLAVIVPTGLSSMRAHWRRDSVDFDLVKHIGPGIFFGVIVGIGLASHLSGIALKQFFSITLLMLAVVMVSDPVKFQLHHRVPPQPWAAKAGFFIGMVSTLIGIGGASFNVPFMTMCRVPIHKAIGTATALGLVIAVPATIGFIAIGWEQPNLPPYSLGYVSWPAWAMIIPFSVLLAPLGAKMAHVLPVDMLRRVFALFILLVGIKMASEAFFM